MYVNCCVGEHEHTIVGYSLVKGIGDGEPIASERFSVGGHEWVSLSHLYIWNPQMVALLCRLNFLCKLWASHPRSSAYNSGHLPAKPRLASTLS